MIKAITIGKFLILGTFTIVVFLAWKSVTLDNLSAKQITYEDNLRNANNRMIQYDRDLEAIRIMATVNGKIIQETLEETRSIKQILLNKK